VELYDAGVGDVIEIPTHHPRTVTVTGWAWTEVRNAAWLGLRGDFTCLSWQGTGPWAGWAGTTLLSDGAEVVMVAKASPDDPARKQYEDGLEAALSALAATIGEE